MEQAARSVRIVRFGVYEIDIHEGEVRKSGRRVTLQDQPFQVLALLLANPGKLVTREELQGQIWPADTFVDFDLGLNTAIKKIRAALGDSADNPRFIETVPKHGYRFIYPVERVEPAAVVEQHEAAGSVLIGESPPPPAQVAVRRYRWWPALAVAVVLTVSALVAFRIVSQRNEARRKADSLIESVAVLPFETASSGPEEEAFANGMTEELITQLAQLGWPGVAARAAVLPYKGRAQSASLIGVALNVDAIVVGTVTREGSQIRITAHLIQVSPEKERWTGKYRKDAANILALQSEVAADITAGIRATLTKKRLAKSTDETQNAAALESALRGQGFMRAYDMPDQYDKAEAAFREAIAADPSYASAYAGLGLACWKKYKKTSDSRWEQCAQQACQDSLHFGPLRAAPHICLATLESGTGQYNQAIEEFSGALQFDPLNTDAHIGRGRSYELSSRAVEAEKDYSQAIASDPNDWRGYALLAGLYKNHERYPEAVKQYELSKDRRPDNSEPLFSLGAVYLELGQYDKAIVTLNKAVDLHPTFGAYEDLGTSLLDERNFEPAIDKFQTGVKIAPEEYIGYGNLARAYLYADRPQPARENYERAIDLAKKKLRVNREDPDANLMLAVYLVMLGRKDEADPYLDRALFLRPDAGETFFWAAVVRLRQGNRARSLEWLRKAHAVKYSPAEIGHAPEFYELRNDPEFKSITAKAEVPAEARHRP